MWNPLKETEYFLKGKPWFLNFFDQLKFYPVTAEEILKYREDFLRGNFKVEIEDTTFNLGEYRKFIEDNKASIKAFKDHQEASFEAERQRWKVQGLDNFISETEDAPTIVDEDIPEGCEAVRASLPGSVWKVQVEEQQSVKEGDILVILESMKMEFPIESKYSGIVEKLYMNPGEQINGGQLVACIKVE